MEFCNLLHVLMKFALCQNQVKTSFPTHEVCTKCRDVRFPHKTSGEFVDRLHSGRRHRRVVDQGSALVGRMPRSVGALPQLPCLASRAVTHVILRKSPAGFVLGSVGIRTSLFKGFAFEGRFL